MSRGEQRAKLWALAAETLSANQYTALWFRYAEGMSITDIAQVMDKTQTHVKVLLFRGRKTLGKKLDPLGEMVSPVAANSPPPVTCASPGRAPDSVIPKSAWASLPPPEA